MSKFLQKLTRSSLSILLVLAMVAAPLTMVVAEQDDYEASFITERNDIKVDYSAFVNSSVMQQLPESIKDDQDISVIITVGEATLLDAYEQSAKTMSLSTFVKESDEAAAINADIAAKRAELLARLDEAGVRYEQGKAYNTLLRGFELVIKGGDFRTVCNNLGKDCGIMVSEEYKVASTQLVENTVNVFDTGIFDSSAAGYDGSGTVVAVLDTGLDSKHSAFSVDNFTSQTLGLTYEDVAKVIKDTKASEQTDGLTVDDVYINKKVPFGYDYADSDPDPYSTHNNHGTHVSGVIVGKDDTITGVAPNAQLVSMKIFSDVMDTARAAWILAALEDCVVLDVDVINMSLGTACGFARESDEELTAGVYEKIRKAGISMIVAASNSYNSAYSSEKNGNLPLTSNPDSGTVGSPSTYEGTMSVASINGVETPYIKFKGDILYFIESTNGTAEENHFCDTLLGDEEKKDIEYVIIPGVGRSADYTGMDVKGKIALVRRGDTTFEEKALIAEAQGAAGIIIYNNVSGDIKMNVGDAKLAVCSISQDDGEKLVAAGGGKLSISKKQTSGPFISDFSSWGPTPSLGIKPEITAHGGEILSSITGGDYDRLSGTSMACPNLAGVVLLLRQYVKENFADIANDSVKVNEMVNRLMMSTADIIYNKNGLPYAIRKQGAGLANLLSSLKTTAYLVTYDKEGNEMDKPKLELGDDKEGTGVYEMTFSLVNFGDKSLSYDLDAIVLTEGVSETKTSHGETTVTEEAYELTGATLEIGSVEGGKLSGKKLTVAAGETAKVTVTVKLGEEDKKYLTDSFANGMYVEGFLTLTAKAGTKIDMNIPYLAFFGDWTKAPQLDLDYFATHADELDEGLNPEDKTMADAYATRPIGGVEDDYVSYLGTYYFVQNPKDIQIAADRKYVALSNQIGTIHSLRYIWTGLLRNAAEAKVTITNDTTGEVIFEVTDDQVRKSYSDGGASIYPANVEVEFDTIDYNLKNNTKYTVKMETTLDYGEDGGASTNKSNTFEFPLTIDFEAPTVTGVEYYFEYDKSLKKNRLYAKVDIYDNHYAMAAQFGYVTTEANEEGNEEAVMKNFDQYLTPVYSEENSTTTITYELTDYVYTLKDSPITKNTFVVSCYDYALNYATFEIGLPTDFTDFYMDGLDEGLTLSPNEVFTLEPLVYPATAWSEMLQFASSRTSVARIVNNKIVAVAPGTSIIKVTDPKTNKSTTFNVTVLKKGDDGYRKYDKPVADFFKLDGYTTKKAYFMVANEDKEIGDDGNIRFFEGNYALSMYPSEAVTLNHTLASYFPRDTKVTYESSNEDIVKVAADGTVTAQAEGFASVTVKVMMDDRSTYYSESVSVEVKDPYVTTGAQLSHYYGLGGSVVIPEDLGITSIGQFSFSNYNYVLKTEEELAFDDAETSKMWYIGENTITKVVIPEGVKDIQAYAFANLTGLEEVVLPSTLQFIEYGAFYGCSKLEKITFSGENNLKVINQNAFENCDLRNTIDLSSACIISDYAFAGNTKLKKVTTGDALQSIGQYAFAGCKKMSEITVTAPKVKYGAYAFTDCESLESFTVNAAVLPEGMFYECKALTEVTIGPDVNDIGPFAFRDTKVSVFKVKDNANYKKQEANYILSADGKTLVAVAPTLEGAVAAANFGGGTITAVGKGAFSHNTKITEVTLPQVTKVGEYGFGSSESVAKVTLGALTQIDDYAFFETAITVAPAFDKKTKMGKYAFSHSGLTSVTIPDGMTVAEGAFSECMELVTVVIGNNVKLEKFAFNVSKDNAFEVKHYDEDGERYFYYEFATKLENLTIGENAVIGENAFAFAASLKKVTLGAGAEIGKMAFYNTVALEEIDLSAVKKIGDYAFSGDVYYVCLDENMTVAAVSKEGSYIYRHFGPALKAVNLAAATELGEHAFSYCRQLTTVTLNDKITELKPYTFAGCIALTSIDLSKIKTVGEYAFIESALTNVNLSAAKTIGEYAFVESRKMTNLTLNPKGVTMDEGAFSYCEALTAVTNMNAAEELGDYAFAHTALTGADLSGAKKLGDHVFLKENFTPFAVTLGKKLESVGDNPFAMCVLQPFCQVGNTEFNGVTYTEKVYDYEVSDNVQVINGSLYCKVDTGLELIAFAAPDLAEFQVADDTVRVSSYAFAGTDLMRVVLPYSTTALGHKAFYGCNKLEMVTFGSYYPPILEEEFDNAYYDKLDHIPGTGDFGTYNDYDGTEVQINGMGLIPYYMWNATGGMYSNVFYGANFKNYVGYVDNKMTMVAPVNGVNYDSYILAQYFDRSLTGAAAPDPVTVAAINAIKAIPERVAYKDKPLVEAARAAYTKIATLLQQSLVYNYADLVSAEQRITALDPNNANNQTQEPTPEPVKKPFPWAVVGIVAGILVLLIAAIVCFKKFKLGEKTPFRQIGAFLHKIFAPVAKFLAPVGKFLAPVGRFFKKIFTPVGRGIKAAALWVGKSVAAGCVAAVAAGKAGAAKRKEKKVAKAAEKAAKAEAKAAAQAEAANEAVPEAETAETEEATEQPAEEMALTDVAAEVPAVESITAEVPVEETPVEEVPVEETPVEEVPTEEAPIEEAPLEVEETPAEETPAESKKAAKHAAKKVKQPSTGRAGAIIKTVLTVIAVIAVVAGVAALVVSLLLNAKQPTPYEENDAQNYKVSVQYDANGGTFTTNTSVITDSYSLESFTPDSDGNVKLALLSPDDKNRGNDAFAPVKNGYFLAGWYQKRTDAGNGEYTYSDPWDFKADRLSIKADGDYSSAQPVLTLYAAWVPEFTIEFCSRGDGAVLNTYKFNPLTDGYELKVPAWDTETGAMEMYKFPQRDGYTFQAAYYDAAGTQPVTGTLTHPGKVDAATGAAVNNTIKVYVDWMEGNWYRISTPEQFIKNASINGSYIIEADLDFTDKTWPTSLMHGNFAGTIQGNGHTFRNIQLTQTNNSKTYGGLFGQLTEKAALSDITFENVTFTVKKGTRVAGTSYGILAGTLSEGAKLTGVTLKDSVLQIDSGCYFGTDDYTIGLTCGTGNPAAVQTAGLTCKAVGDAPETVVITVDGNEITLQFNE